MLSIDSRNNKVKKEEREEVAIVVIIQSLTVHYPIPHRLVGLSLFVTYFSPIRSPLVKPYKVDGVLQVESTSFHSYTSSPFFTQTSLPSTVYYFPERVTWVSKPDVEYLLTLDNSPRPLSVPVQHHNLPVMSSFSLYLVLSLSELLPYVKGVTSPMSVGYDKEIPLIFFGGDDPSTS